MLKWSTPKSTSLDVQCCTSAYRVTPTNVSGTGRGLTYSSLAEYMQGFTLGGGGGTCTCWASLWEGGGGHVRAGLHFGEGVGQRGAFALLGVYKLMCKQTNLGCHSPKIFNTQFLRPFLDEISKLSPVYMYV